MESARAEIIFIRQSRCELANSPDRILYSYIESRRPWLVSFVIIASCTRSSIERIYRSSKGWDRASRIQVFLGENNDLVFDAVRTCSGYLAYLYIAVKRMTVHLEFA